MTRRRPVDMLVATAEERALKAVETKREVRLSLLSILRGQRAALELADMNAETGDPDAIRRRDRLALAVQRTAAALRE